MKYWRTVLTAVIAGFAAAAKNEGDKTGSLQFIPLTKEDGRRLGGSAWGHICCDCDPQYCFEPYMGNTAPYTRVVLKKYNGNNKQIWKWDGKYLKSRLDDNICMEIPQSYEVGSKVRINNCMDNSNQKWVFDDDNLMPKVDKDLCAFPKDSEISNLVKIVLINCGDLKEWASMDWVTTESP
uniref:Ricin B lectin domain-containing protein n=1 Tax=Odontella aurita TaxID=265563 RepID=A0A7S4N6Z3_9STRA|mmetsp:Transcript_51029/g.153389  ORF Transcript_51029/g.153389 Transcript_51029/m.153389 type:complete len:181 (+) Transcript_51029:242-784(+)